jgi:asparagine synthase (glutamine-hydrolysing)
MLLKCADYDRVACFSYGVPGNHEASLSRTVAEELGYDWHFVPYSTERWGSWTQSNLWRDYFERAHLGVSIPMMQGWPACMELRQQGVVPDDSLFVPGLLGDFVAGNLSRPEFYRSPDMPTQEVASRIVSLWYGLWRDEPARSRDLAGSVERVQRQIEAHWADDRESPATAYESWLWRERESKFIVNAVRVYDFWGYDWWLPFADQEVRDIWQRIPANRRLGKDLYSRLVTEFTPNTLGASDTSALRHKKPEHTDLRRALRRLDRFRVLSKLQSSLRERRSRHTMKTPYALICEGDPLGWWGAVDQTEFERDFTGRESIYSFMSQKLLREQYGWSRVGRPA